MVNSSHNSSSHQRYLLIIILLACAIILLLVLFPGGTASRAVTPADKLASCLREKNVAMFGVDTCSECQNQKQIFGSNFKNIKYVNCDFQSEFCDANQVEIYPTWIHGNKKLQGLQSLPNLASFSGCPYSE